jgi:hypothetical protein
LSFLTSSLDRISEIFPSQLRHTHSITTAPHSSSFEALLQSYGERIHAATPALSAEFGGFFTTAVEGIETALESVAEWVTDGLAPMMGGKTFAQNGLGGEVSPAVYLTWSKGSPLISTVQASSTFRQSIRDLISFLGNERHPDEKEIQLPSYQALRFEGLGEIQSTYGSDSEEYKQAKEMLRAILEAAVSKVDGLARSASHRLAFITIPEQEATLMPRSIDMLSPFRSSLSLTPFLSTRDFSLSANDTKAPKESEYIGKCFSSEKDLNKATSNCSSHGTPVQSSRGGAKCYRCNCKPTKGKSGRVTAWAGAACQKQDISKPFVLLLSTTVILIFVIFGSVYYLFNEGEKELPSVLAGISIPNK